MLLDKYEKLQVLLYLEVIKEKASAKFPLHRAKAMKLAKPSREAKLKLLSANEKEEFWEMIKSEGWVQTNNMGYITGLAPKALKFVGV